jgi:hypothetical protein
VALDFGLCGREAVESFRAVEIDVLAVECLVVESTAAAVVDFLAVVALGLAVVPLVAPLAVLPCAPGWTACRDLADEAGCV